MALVVPSALAAEQLHEHGALGTRADEAHLAARDVDQLRQLVHAAAPQQPPEPRATILAFDPSWRGAGRQVEPLRPLMRGPHRAELEQIEDLPVAADTLLAEEDGPRRFKLDREG